MSEAHLKRTVTLPYITFYGLGTILGAGVYVLIGKIAGAAGLFAPIAFLVSALVAGLTAFSYCELSSRFPVSAGESVYCQEAFGWPRFAQVVGYFVILTVIVSAATIANGFVGYLQLFVPISPGLAISMLLLFLTFLAILGITESVGFATLVTLLELFGLVFVISVAGNHLGKLPDAWPTLWPSLNFQEWYGIVLGAFLAFYAFIGFEDMVNISEEVKSPERNMPKAIIISLAIATLLYIIVAIIAVLAMPIPELAQSGAPLAALLKSKGEWAEKTISAISLVAVVNGALVQIIMASRVIYGMGKKGLISPMLSKLHPKTKTPIYATLLTGVVVWGLALWFPLVYLAKATSFIVLTIFIIVNIALIKLKQQNRPGGEFHVSIGVPIFGVITSLGLIVMQINAWLMGGLVAGH